MAIRARFRIIFFNIILTILFCYPGSYSLTAQGKTEYGLSFLSHEVIKEKRTSFNPAEGKPFQLGKKTTLSFDFSFLRSSKTFGYVFRIIDNLDNNYDLLVNSFTHDKAIILVDGPNEPEISFAKDEFHLSQWNKAILIFDKERNAISFSLNGKVKQIAHNLKDVSRIELFFGRNDRHNLATTDVPPINIKDITLITDDRKILDIPLEFHNNNQTPNIVNGDLINIQNGKWLIDNHKYWSKASEPIIAGRNAQIAFDSKTGKLFIADSASLKVLIKGKNEVEVLRYNKGSIFNSLSNQMLYDPSSNNLVQYDIQNKHINRFNFETKSWSIGSFLNQDEPAFWHHVSAISPLDSSLYTFGGYGFFTYKNDIFRNDLRTGEWTNLSFDGKTNPHKYLSGGAFNKDGSELYIFGGYGNTTGKQQLSPSHFYDLHFYDLKTKKLSKLWELKYEGGRNFVVAKSMIPDEADSSLYALSFSNHQFNTQLQLLKINIKKPEIVEVGDSIPFHFDDTRSFVDLFYSAPDSSLLAVISEKLADGATEIRTYSINFPVINIGFGSLSKKHKKGFVPVILIIAAFVIIVFAGLYYRKAKIKRDVRGETVASYEERRLSNHKDITPLQPKKVEDSLKEREDEGVYDDTSNFRKSETRRFPIQLIGDFKIVGEDGTAVSDKMTPMMIQVFCLIYFSTLRSQKGISSGQMNLALWPDKTEESARNNRSVNIRKLRKVLEQIPFIKIMSDNNYWRIVFDKEMGSDYSFVLNEISNPKTNENTFWKVVENIEHGLLLPGLEASWLDEFKSDFNYKLSNYLTKNLPEILESNQPNQITRLFSCLEKTDLLDEDVLLKKCKYYLQNEHVMLAKNTFQKFKSDYKRILGIDYEHSFDELLQEES